MKSPSTSKAQIPRPQLLRLSFPSEAILKTWISLERISQRRTVPSSDELKNTCSDCTANSFTYSLCPKNVEIT